MHFVSFIIAFVFILVAAILSLYGLVKLHRGSDGARDLVSSGLMTGILGILVSVIVFGVFTI